MGYRHDGTSAFSSDNRWGDFYNFGLGWDMKKENWLADVDWLNQLKVRGSFGQTGNDNHLASTLDASPSYHTFYAYTDQYNLTGANGVFSDGVLAYKGNPDLKWEKTNAFDFGVDYAFFGGRLNGALDFYYRSTSNLLDFKNVAMSNGYTTIPVNVGTIHNYGLEFDVNYDIITTSSRSPTSLGPSPSTEPSRPARCTSSRQTIPTDSMSAATASSRRATRSMSSIFPITREWIPRLVWPSTPA